MNADEMYLGKYSDILSVKPGLSSPASIFDYTHGEEFESEEKYVDEFLPKKLDIELYYVNHCGAIYDLRIICRTVKTIIQKVFGKKDFKEPRELYAKD